MYGSGSPANRILGQLFNGTVCHRDPEIAPLNALTLTNLCIGLL
ncbi:hypothetical protein T12_3955 [Trichinella patagoniensis]|uniref:Uncharacterized protein n=1 Tax=Trichinella patagoniensis TaxID=990121 RepID=A0A0V0YYX1_9BILA|nr:hypothetical protein T12_5877 [Trichinella patagoniensis]KRY06656.1 hypothetical protein T12_3955 [Trichinella patagoniensis]